MADLTELGRVLDWLEDHPDHHYQGHWVYDDGVQREVPTGLDGTPLPPWSCHTTACLAGWTAILHGWTPRSAAGWVVDRGRESSNVAWVATVALGLDPEEATILFYECEDIAEMRAVAAVMTDGGVTSFRDMDEALESHRAENDQ
jgi:hypothetical protein